MKYYCEKQQDLMDCGVACIATICKQNEFDVSITKLREMAGTDKNGTNVFGMIKALEELGFTAKGVRGDKEALFTQVTFPCIAHVVVNESLFHYVVIHKVTKKHIIIADPAKGIVKLTKEEFLGKSHDNSKHEKYKWSGILILAVKNELNDNYRNKDSIAKRFFKIVMSQKKLFGSIFVLSLICTIIGIVGAFYFRGLIDIVLPNSLKSMLTIMSIGVIALNILKIGLGAIRSHLFLKLSQRLDISLFLGYYRHVLSLPMSFFDTRKVGEIISRFNDAGKVREALSSSTLTIMIDTVMAIAGAIILCSQNTKLFMISLAVVVCYAIIVLLFNKKYEDLNCKQMEENAKLTSYMVESLNGIQTVKVYNAENKAKVETERRFGKLLKSIFKLGFLENIQGSLKDALEVVGGILILWVGGMSVIDGRMTIGQLITFNSLLMYFEEPVKNLVNLQPQIQTATVAAKRLVEILDLEVEKTARENSKIYPENICEDIKISNLNFRYGTRKKVLCDINLNIKKGEKVAFVGKSGSGKSTLAKLLLGMYGGYEGDILIGNNNIKDVKIDAIREKIAYVSQETFLFSGTILENFMFGIDKVSLEDVIRASQIAQAHDFIIRLPCGYQTILDENGSNLSGGQRQRIAIARAILKKPDILILDEATSNIDTVTEYELSKTISESCSGITVIFIAHRLSTIRECDKIYVMEDGKIVESGTHNKLLEGKTKYREFLDGKDIGKAG